MPAAILRILCALVFAAALTTAPASADGSSHDITITFVRHGESLANAGGSIDTSVPGPPLTPKGEQQAKDVAAQLAVAPHDGVYASSLLRTQQTAQYLADELNKQVVVLPELREIGAGDFEGKSDQGAVTGYFAALKQWLAGDRSARIPGSIDGDEFNARFTDSVDQVYRSGQQQPVVYSHGAAIAMWTLMNAKNAPPELLETQPLPNTGQVVVRGNPDDGWTLLNWNGTPFG